MIYMDFMDGTCTLHLPKNFERQLLRESFYSDHRSCSYSSVVSCRLCETLLIEHIVVWRSQQYEYEVILLLDLIF